MDDVRDLLFEQILDELQEIHLAMPEKRFGALLQQAVDEHKGGFNKNLNDLSSKEVLAALQVFCGKHKAVRLATITKRDERLERKALRVEAESGR